MVMKIGKCGAMGDGRWAGRGRHVNNEGSVKKLYDGASGKGTDDRPRRRWMDKTD